MIWRLLLALFVFGMIMAVFQMVMVALVVGGLIFRTRETLGLLVVAGLFALIRLHPVIGIGVVGFIGFCAVMGAKQKAEKAKALPEAVETPQ